MESRIPFILVDDSQTGLQACEQATHVQYIVLCFGDGRYAVIRPEDLKRKLLMWHKLDVPLKDVPENALSPHLAQTMRVDSLELDARLKDLSKAEVLVVIDDHGFYGLAIGQKEITRTGGKEIELPAPILRLPGKLAVAAECPDSAVPAEAAPRYINVEVRDRTGQPFAAKEKPLQIDESYRLLFDIDTSIRKDSLVASRFAEERAFNANEEEIELTVQLSSDDFKIRPEQQNLYVPRQGRSVNVAEFNIVPLHSGPGLINAVFLKANNFIQVMTLKFFVGELFTYETLGREVNGAASLGGRDVSLTILNTGTGFQLILISPGVAATANLPLKLAELKDITDQARDKLLALVNYQKNQRYFYQQAIDIPEDVHTFALQQLAEAGFRLYQRIFFGPSADEQSKNLGRKLRELAQKEKLKIQIFSQDFVLPWALLYMADGFDPNKIRPDLFLGLKHIVEHIPLQQSLSVTDNRVDGSGGLVVSLNVNTDIDKQMNVPLIGSQIDYWETLKSDGAKVSIITRKTTNEVTNALATPETPDQVLYFYCHGLSQDVADQGGVSQSALVFSDDGRLTLDDLNLFAPPDKQLQHAPLIFINACESAKLSPLIYDGFVPYFMAKGARGVIGTEVETPALFAVHWATRFFDRFLQGEALGEIFLALRKEFVAQHHNVMGLLYALYVDGDTRIEPAVKS